MTDRDKLLARFNAGQFEAPTTDTNLRKVANVFRETVRDQGQVMSAALDNNHNLYHANKQLRKDNAELANEIQGVRAGINARDVEIRRLTVLLENIEALTPKLTELHATIEECTKWKAHATEYQRILVSYLYEELNQERLRAKLDEMKAQKAEIIETGQVHVEKPEGDDSGG